MPQLVRLKGVVDKNNLARSFRKLIDRHEILRTSFTVLDDGPVQVVHDSFSFELEEFSSDESGIDAVGKEFIRPFDLSRWPLLRVGLVSLSSEDHVLMVDMHHIITDGVSQGVLIRDFMSYYRGETLPSVTLHYKDYAEWQQ